MDFENCYGKMLLTTEAIRAYYAELNQISIEHFRNVILSSNKDTFKSGPDNYFFRRSDETFHINVVGHKKYTFDSISRHELNIIAAQCPQGNINRALIERRCSA